ncbi:hypothetical protein ACLB0R_05385 [Sphingomonas sp. GlSt437]|uniref:hypothetical protein n=1 Tax=Sphingomonas sp. GlSt437 TaxID=3389970 RepID=UPI003A87A062
MANRIQAGIVMVSIGTISAVFSYTQVRTGMKSGSIITSNSSDGGSSSDYREYNRVNHPLRFRLILARHAMGIVIGIAIALFGALLIL